MRPRLPLYLGTKKLSQLRRKVSLICYTEIMPQSVNQHLFHLNSKASWFHVIRSDKMDKNQHFYRKSFNIIASAMITMLDLRVFFKNLQSHPFL